MNELLSLTGLAKTRMDAGFSRIGRRLSPSEPVDRLLMVLAARSVSQANAIGALSERGLANEALPILRGLAEACLAMRWAVSADMKARAERALQELEASDWGTQWPDARWRERAEAYQVDAPIAALVLGSAADFARGCAQGLPWAHVVASAARPGRRAEELLGAAASLLGHALKALDSRWPGEFPGAEELWSRAKISRGQ